MPINRFPALATRGPDVRGNALAASRVAANRQGIESSRIHNALALREADFVENRAAQGNQASALAGQVAGLPAGQDRDRALLGLTALDPARGNALRGAMESMDKGQLDRAARTSEQIGKVSLAYLAAPPDQQTAQWPRVRQAAIELGADPSEVPQAFGPEALAYVREQATLAQSVAQLAGELPGRDVLSPEAEAQKARIAGAGATQVNVGPQGQDFGDPPKDHVWARNQDGSIALQADPETGFSAPIAVPVAGSPAAAKAETAGRTQFVKARKGTQQALRVLGQISDARKMVSEQGPLSPVTGLTGSFLRDVGGTEAFNLQKIVQSIQAAISFNELSAMREASKTGGAVGQLTDKERIALADQVAALDTAQDEDQFLRQLAIVETSFADTVHGYSLMSREQLQNVDVGELSEPSLRAYLQAIDIIEGGGSAR